MCYNVLCDKYATRQLYGYCPSWALNWDYRKKAIIQEILSCNADIISLQVSKSICLNHTNAAALIKQRVPCKCVVTMTHLTLAVLKCWLFVFWLSPRSIPTCFILQPYAAKLSKWVKLGFKHLLWQLNTHLSLPNAPAHYFWIGQQCYWNCGIFKVWFFFTTKGNIIIRA